MNFVDERGNPLRVFPFSAPKKPAPGMTSHKPVAFQNNAAPHRQLHSRLFLVVVLMAAILSLNVASAQTIDNSLRNANEELKRLGLEGLEAADVFDLRTTQFPPIPLLRDEWEIPLPADPRVIVLKLTEPERKEQYLRKFDNLFLPQNQPFRETGKTFYGRFVLVDPSLRPNSLLSESEYRRVMGHELVHAYLMSSLGSERDKLPRWFHEGIATHLGRMGAHTATEEYRYFASVFEYLEEYRGADTLRDFVLQAATVGSVDDTVLSLVGVRSDGELFAAATSWVDTERVLMTAPIVLSVFLWFVRGGPLTRNPRRVILHWLPLFWRAGARNRRTRRELYLLSAQGLAALQTNLQALQEGLGLPVGTAVGNTYELHRMVRVYRQIQQDEKVLGILQQREAEGQGTYVLRKQIERVSGRLEVRRAHFPHLVEIRSGSPEVSQRLQDLAPVFTWLKRQPRDIRRYLWGARAPELRALASILDKWSKGKEIVWRKTIRRGTMLALILVFVLSWGFQVRTARKVFPMIHWIVKTF